MAATVTAYISNNEVSPYILHPSHTITIRELWLPAPYSLCLNLSDDQTNVFASSKHRFAETPQKVTVSREFAERCQRLLSDRTKIKEVRFFLDDW